MISPHAVAPVLAAAAAAIVLAVVVLWRLPEPREADHDEQDASTAATAAAAKRTYGSLLRPWFVIMVGLLAAATTAIAVIQLDPAVWAPWVVLAVFGSVLAMIDATTTWLPNAVMYPFWAAMAVAAMIMVALGLRGSVISLLVGGAAWMGVFWIVWAVSGRQLGFGDVRLALGLGAAAGAAGWVTIYTCLLAGTLIGSGWGVVHRARHGRRPGPFPYGMALFLGCGVGLALTPR